jgi:hypothetical protein
MPAAMIRDTNDGKKWSTPDKRDLTGALEDGDSIGESATLRCRAAAMLA